jgi:hypothetical protein
MSAQLPNPVANVLRSVMQEGGEDVDEGHGEAATKEVSIEIFAKVTLLAFSACHLIFLIELLKFKLADFRNLHRSISP